MEATFYLTDAQLRKLKKNLPFQLTHKQLIGEGMGKHSVDLQMLDGHADKVMNAINKKKGFRFNSNNIIGGKLNMRDILKNPLTKSIANSTVKRITNLLVNKGTINKRQAEKVNDISEKVIDGNLKQAQKEAIIEIDKPISGTGVKGRLVKGSKEAKDYMASIRAKRKVNGGNLRTQFSDFKKGFKQGFMGTMNVAKNIALQPNVLGAVVLGQPEIAIGALGMNAVNYGLSKLDNSKTKVNLGQMMSAVSNAKEFIDNDGPTDRQIVKGLDMVNRIQRRQKKQRGGSMLPMTNNGRMTAGSMLPLN